MSETNSCYDFTEPNIVVQLKVALYSLWKMAMCNTIKSKHKIVPSELYIHLNHEWQWANLTYLKCFLLFYCIYGKAIVETYA